MKARALASALRSLLALVAFVPTLAWPTRQGGPDAGTVVALLLLWAYAGTRSALSALDPLEEETFFAKRVRRLVLLPVGMALGGSALFPVLTAWPYVWFVIAMVGVLQRFAFVPEVAVALGWLAGIGVLAQLVLAPSAVWSLVPLFALLFVVPGLDRYAEAQGRQRTPPSPLPLLRAGAVVAAAVFALTLLLAWALPDPFPAIVETPEFDLDPGQAPVPRLPLPQIAFGGMLLGLMWVIAQRVGRAAVEAEQPPPAEMQVELDEVALDGAPPLCAWDAGPRRAAIDAYLAHRAALGRRGTAVSPAQTPAQWASTLPADAAPKIAEAFGRARWSPEPFAEEEVDRLRGWIRDVEGGVSDPSEASDP
ncbi:MAG: DUF4129 domain-containing protein [Planctomycetota bacterium]